MTVAPAASAASADERPGTAAPRQVALDHEAEAEKPDSREQHEHWDHRGMERRAVQEQDHGRAHEHVGDHGGSGQDRVVMERADRDLGLSRVALVVGGQRQQTRLERGRQRDHDLRDRLGDDVVAHLDQGSEQLHDDHVEAVIDHLEKHPHLHPPAVAEHPLSERAVERWPVVSEDRPQGAADHDQRGGPGRDDAAGDAQTQSPYQDKDRDRLDDHSRDIEAVEQSEAEHAEQLVAGGPAEQRDRYEGRREHPRGPALTAPERVGDRRLKHPGQRHDDHRDQRGVEHGVTEDGPLLSALAAGEIGDGERLPDSGHRDGDGAERQHQREQAAIGRTQ